MRHRVVAQADVAGLAVHAAVAGEAAVGVVGVDDREHRLAGIEHRAGVGADDHALGDAAGAGELQAARAFDLDQAGAAAGVGLQAVDVAEVGDEDAVLLDDLDQRRPGGGLDLDAVEGELSHGWRSLLVEAVQAGWVSGRACRRAAARRSRPLRPR